ncbi:odorant receptor 10-like [Osmia lignaria lignaria]|uniref:odorant receptor 10-like n=1 Tax=Osmia lignaria lignaria TaxID=1437193 RepID=UPI00402BBB6A
MATIEPTIKQADLENLSDHSLQLNKWLLKPIGAWPRSSTSTNMETISSLIMISVCYFCIVITVVPSIMYMILDDDVIDRKLKVVGPLSHWFIGGLNYTTLLMRSKEIQFCMNQMKRDWRAVTKLKDLQMMIKDAQFGRYVVVFCAAFMQVGVLCFCVVKAFTEEIIHVGNETRISHMLPCPAYKKLILAYTSPVNEIFFVVQFFSGFVANSTAAGAFSFAAVFAVHAYGQLNLLMMWIQELVNRSEKYNKRVDLNEIGVIVENHLKILNFISHIENIMNMICFMELFKCTVCICMLEYHILMDWAVRDFQAVMSYIVILCSMSFNIFIVCYIGEKLSDQCNKVGEAVYMTNWYYLHNKDILNLIMIISRANVVTKITAGKILHMSFNTFAGMMKTAFAYLNVLRQTL